MKQYLQKAKSAFKATFDPCTHCKGYGVLIVKPENKAVRLITEVLFLGMGAGKLQPTAHVFIPLFTTIIIFFLLDTARQILGMGTAESLKGPICGVYVVLVVLHALTFHLPVIGWRKEKCSACDGTGEADGGNKHL